MTVLAQNKAKEGNYSGTILAIFVIFIERCKNLLECLEKFTFKLLLSCLAYPTVNFKLH